jgi:hypothetical protein
VCLLVLPDVFPFALLQVARARRSGWIETSVSYPSSCSLPIFFSSQCLSLSRWWRWIRFILSLD